MLQAELRQMDAFRLLEELPANSIDLIVSSPPYFMGKEYDTSTSVDDFIDAHKRLFPLLLACLKPGGSLCWQVGNHVADGVLVPLDALVFSSFQSKELLLRNRIVWTFGHGVHAKKRFSGRHETILWYTKGKDHYFDLDAVRVPQKYPGKRHYKGAKKGEFSGNPLGKNPGDVWDIPNVKANHIEKTEHPCQFPVGLVQRLVRSLCPEGGVVVDPFAGSASTGVAALAEGRCFIGSEINDKYLTIGRDRLEAATLGKAKFRPFDTPVYQSKGTDAVSLRPSHFSARSLEKAVD